MGERLVERQWMTLLQKLRNFPLDWRADEVNTRRLDALGKEVRLSDVYAACPSLRKRVASFGGLGKLWVASHSWNIEDQVIPEEQLPMTVPQQVSEENQEEMWLQLLADLRRYPPSWNAHLHKDLRGALLGRQLHLAHRFARSPQLRRRLDQEGGLCNLWQKVHEPPEVQGAEAVRQSAMLSRAQGGIPAQHFQSTYSGGYGSSTSYPMPPPMMHWDHLLQGADSLNPMSVLLASAPEASDVPAPLTSNFYPGALPCGKSRPYEPGYMPYSTGQGTGPSYEQNLATLRWLEGSQDGPFQSI